MDNNNIDISSNEVESNVNNTGDNTTNNTTNNISTSDIILKTSNNLDTNVANNLDTNVANNLDTNVLHTNVVVHNTMMDDIPTSQSYKETKEFIIFKNELESLINNNLYILKECKANKRLLDIKYASLTTKVNYIQISVIVLSTLSGFLQSTKEYFSTPSNSVTVCGISISTYISLILSVSKYFKFDEKKESVHNLREKYGNLHNKIEFRMDLLGPYTNYKLWEHQDAVFKLKEWSILKKSLEDEYISLIENKQALTTEFESIMDSKSRNKNYIRDRELTLNNREKLFKSMEKHNALETKIKSKNIPTDFTSVIQLPDDDLNNWDDPV